MPTSMNLVCESTHSKARPIDCNFKDNCISWIKPVLHDLYPHPGSLKKP